jgi:hypothetical protein
VSHPEPPQPVGPLGQTAVGLWSVAVLGFGIGDVMTTAVGIHVVGVVELNPLLGGLLGDSVLGTMVAVKLLVLCGGYLLSCRLPRVPALGVPLGLVLLGVSVTVWNFHVVLRAVTG